MAEQQPTYVDDMCYSANDLRLMQGGLVCSEGVGAFSQLLVTQTTPASADVTVSEGHAFVYNDSAGSDGGMYHVYNDGPVTLTVPLNSSGVDRLDSIWVQICDSEYAPVTSGFTLYYLEGSLVAPSDGCTYYKLANLTVPDGVGSGGSNVTGTPTYFGDTDGIIFDARIGAFQLCGDDGGWVNSLPTALDFPSVAANGGTQGLNITVHGASVGDPVVVGAPSSVLAGLVWNAHVVSTDTVQVRLTNTTGTPIDPASATWTVAVKIR